MPGAGASARRSTTRGRQSLLGQQVRQARRLVRGEDDSIAVGRPAEHRLGQARGPGRRQRRLAPAEEVAHRRPAAGRRGGLRLPGQLQGSAAQQARLPVARPQVRLRPLVGQLAGGDQLGAPFLGLAPQEVGRVGDVAGLVEDQERAGGEVVQAGGGAQDGGPDLGRVAGLEGAGRRGDVVDVAGVSAELAGAGAHSLLEAGQVGGQALRQMPGEAARQARDAGPDLRDAAGWHQELTGGQQDHFLDGADAALVGRIEDAHRVDLVAEQLDPDRQRRGRREDVDQAAAARELAAAGDLQHRVVAEGEQLAQQLVPMNPGTDAQAGRLGRHFVRVQGVLKQRRHARDEDAGTAGAPCGQGGDARRGLVADELAAFVGERRPRLEHGHGLRVAEPGLQLLGHAIADLGVAGYPAQPLARATRRAVQGEGRGQERLGTVRHRGQRGVPAAGREWSALRIRGAAGAAAKAPLAWSSGGSTWRSGSRRAMTPTPAPPPAWRPAAARAAWAASYATRTAASTCRSLPRLPRLTGGPASPSPASPSAPGRSPPMSSGLLPSGRRAGRARPRRAGRPRR